MMNVFAALSALVLCGGICPAAPVPATRPVLPATKPATRPVEATLPPLEPAVAEAIRLVNQLAAEPAPANASSLQLEEWSAKQAMRQKQASDALVGRQFSAVLVAQDIATSDPRAARPMIVPQAGERPKMFTAFQQLAPPAFIAAAQAKVTKSAAETYDHAIAEATSRARAATTAESRRSRTEDLNALKTAKEKFIAESRHAIAAAKGTTEVIVEAPDDRFGKLQKGAILRGVFRVASFSVEAWGAGDRFEPASTARAWLTVAIVDPSHPATLPATVTAGTAKMVQLQQLADEMRATYSRFANEAAAVPAPALTTIQRQQWATDQKARLAKIAASLEGRRFSMTMPVTDVVPFTQASDTARFAGITMERSGAKTAVIGTVVMAIPAKSINPGEPPQGGAMGGMKVILIDADDRFASKSKGEMVSADVEVKGVMFEEHPRHRQTHESDEVGLIVLSTAAPVANVVPTISRPAGAGTAVRRVVFVLDGSGSMTNSFALAKGATNKAIQLLGPESLFDVIVTADGGPTTLSRTLLKADAANAKKAAAFLEEATVSGTDSLPAALAAASNLRPNFVWIISDGEIEKPEPTIAAVRSFAVNTKAKINTTVVCSDARIERVRQLQAIANAGGGVCVDAKTKAGVPEDAAFAE